MQGTWRWLALVLLLAGCQMAPAAVLVVPLPDTATAQPSPSASATPTSTPSPTEKPLKPVEPGALQLTELATATFTPSVTPGRTPTPRPSYTPPASITPLRPDAPFADAPRDFFVGFSREHRRIDGWVAPASDWQAEDGSGLVLVGAIHGDEDNTLPILDGLQAEIEAGALALPPNLSLYLIPVLNPDGQVVGSRFNAWGVDLNRNWDTYDWQTDTDTAFGTIPGGGGPFAFSEPETRAMRDWLWARQLDHAGGLVVVYLHAAYPPAGMVTPGWLLVDGAEVVDGESQRLGRLFAAAAGVAYEDEWTGSYGITGDASVWAAGEGMPSFTVEMPTRYPLDDAELAAMRAGVLALIDALGR